MAKFGLFGIPRAYGMGKQKARADFKLFCETVSPYGTVIKDCAFIRDVRILAFSTVLVLWEMNDN